MLHIRLGSAPRRPVRLGCASLRSPGPLELLWSTPPARQPPHRRSWQRCWHGQGLQHTQPHRIRGGTTGRGPDVVLSASARLRPPIGVPLGACRLAWNVSPHGLCTTNLNITKISKLVAHSSFCVSTIVSCRSTPGRANKHLGLSTSLTSISSQQTGRTPLR